MNTDSAAIIHPLSHHVQRPRLNSPGAGLSEANLRPTLCHSGAGLQEIVRGSLSFLLSL